MDISSPPANHRKTFSYKNQFVHKRLFFSLTTFFLVVFFLQSINADVISLNAGGSTNLSVSTDKYIEGFFFFGGVCGDSIVDSSLGEQCDDGNTANGDGCSNICQTEAAVTPTPSPGGGGGGGGGEVAPLNIIVTPAEFNINMAVDTTVERTISVTNNGTGTIIVTLTHTLEDHLIVRGSSSFSLQPGQTKNFNVVFVALSEPISNPPLTGKIFIGGKEVLVSLNIKTKLLLFDSNIVVLNKDITVAQGGELKTIVTLIPLGDPERLDVTLNFAVKDYTNKVYLTKSETLLVEKLTELRRNFDTGLLPPGDYVIGLELVYSNGVAPSSAHFRVVEKTPISIFGRIVLYLIIMILVVAILIIIILILRRRKKKKKATTREEI